MKRNFVVILFMISLIFFNSCEREIHREYYCDGTLKEEYTMRNDKYYGMYKSFYPDGSWQAIGEYSNNKMVGIWKYYYSNCIIMSIQKFNNGHLFSLDFWDINGKQTIFDGTGVAESYYPSGALESRINYYNNELDGKFEHWYENGNKKYEFNYDKGKAVGIWRYWNGNGDLVDEERQN